MESRLGKLFQVGGEWFFFDAGTDKILECEEKEAELFQCILENPEAGWTRLLHENPKLGEEISKEQLFQCPEHREFLVPSFDEYRTTVAQSCEQIILEVTQACNLRCKYCIYNDDHKRFREFTSRRMTRDTAFKALDLVLDHLEADSFGLTYYGGEPLLNFQLIKDTIAYTLQKRPDLEINVSFTTNLTRMNVQIADYLRCVPVNSVSVLCSMDGREAVHNAYRQYKDGQGSFSDALRGFRILMDHFFDPDRKRNVAINTVMTPSYSRHKLEDIRDFFLNELKIPEKVRQRITYMDPGEMRPDASLESAVEGKNVLRSIPLEEWAMDCALEENSDERLMEMLSKELWMLATRQRNPNGVIEQTVHMANCIPGQRRLYVTAEGNFLTCERVGNAPFLGNVNRGFDWEKSYETYYIKFDQFFSARCDECWARTLCSLCYNSLMGQEGPPEEIDQICAGSRCMAEDVLKLYCGLLKTNRDFLKQILTDYEYR